MITVEYKKLDKERAKSPIKGHKEDVGWDLTATTLVVDEHHIHHYGTGLAFHFPKGYWGDIRPRSSIYKTGLMLCNSIGTIDRGYTGEVKAKFYHVVEGLKPYDVNDRICQLVVVGADPEEVEFIEVDEFSETLNRGAKGFGSTGK